MDGHHLRKVLTRLDSCFCPASRRIPILPIYNPTPSRDSYWFLYPVRSGVGTLFWVDCWSGQRPFTSCFMLLFNICTAPQIVVEATLANLGNLAFRRTFSPLELDQWEELLECVALHTPSLEHDSISWHLELSGLFSARSLHAAIAATPGPEELNLLWEMKLPMKIRIFLWQLVHGISHLE